MAEKRYTPPYAVAGLVSGAVFLLYLATLAPSTAFWDASEYIATAHIFGIPHPPGNPLFVVLARSWSVLLAPTGLSVAVRVNLFAAFTSALASGFVYLVAHRILVKAVSPGWPALAGAAAAAVLGATTYTVWSQSTVNEKVYTVSVLVIAAVTWLALLWRDRRHKPGSERILVAAIYLMVLGSTNHLMSVLPAPALVCFVLLVGPSVLLRGRFWLRTIPAVILGLSFNLILPARAAQNPVISEGDPRCESVAGAVTSVYTLGRAGCPRLSSVLTREQYQKPPVTQRMAPFTHQLANWFQYFDWQWARGADPHEVPGNARLPFTLLFAIMALVGLGAVWQSDRQAFLFIAPLTATLTLALIFYLNFRFGYSLAPPGVDGSASEVRERDYFFVAGFLFSGLLAGLGLAWAWGWVALSLRSRGAWVLTSPVLLVALIPLSFNWAWASRTGDYAARDWAYDILMSVEPYGVIFTNGDNDTFPLWYLQEVEGIRRDVTVVVGQYLFTTWYPRQLQELTGPGRQRRLGPESAVALYGEASPPTGPITAADPARLDAVQGVILESDATVTFPELAVTYPAGTELNRSHQLALSIIRDSIDERPIYFASSAGMMSELGLERWGVRHGLVTKFEPRPLDEPGGEGIVQTSPGFGGEWFDYPRSMRLYREVYSFRGLRERAVWSDRATLNIPWYYYLLSLQLADVSDLRGEPDELIEQLGIDARAFLVTAQGGTVGTPAL